MRKQTYRLSGELLEIALAWHKEEYSPYLAKVKEAQSKLCDLPDFGFYTFFDIMSAKERIDGIANLPGLEIEGLRPDKKDRRILVTNGRTKKGKEMQKLFDSLASPQIIGPVQRKLGHKIFYTGGGKIAAASYGFKGDKYVLDIPIHGVTEGIKNNKDLVPLTEIEYDDWWGEEK